MRPGVSVGGTLAYDPTTGTWVTSDGVRLGKPSRPQFTGVSPKPDGLNAETNSSVELGPYGEVASRFTLNVAPDLSVSGSYRAKGTVTMPDGRSYEMEVVVERRADGTWHTKLPDGVTTSTPLPGGGSVDTTKPADPTKEREQPEVKGPAPEAKKSDSWFNFGGGVSVDKEIRPAPLPPSTAEELERAKESYAREHGAQQERADNWKAQNRPEAERREGMESARDAAAAEEAARRSALPDREHDGRPDTEDATPNQNDTDPARSDVGDGPEGGEGYGQRTDADQGGSDSGTDTGTGIGTEGTGGDASDADGDGLSGSAASPPTRTTPTPPAPTAATVPRAARATAAPPPTAARVRTAGERHRLGHDLRRGRGHRQRLGRGNERLRLGRGNERLRLRRW